MIALLAPIAASAVALQAVPARDPETDPEDAIIVMAERLRSIEVNVGRDREGNWQCSLSASSGSEIIDSRLCRTTTHCVRENQGDRAATERCVRDHRSRTLEDFRRQIRSERER